MFQGADRVGEAKPSGKCPPRSEGRHRGQEWYHQDRRGESRVGSHLCKYQLQADTADWRQNAVKLSPVRQARRVVTIFICVLHFDSPITYTIWLDRCQRVKTLVNDKMSDSYSFRETARVMREHAWNDIRAQQDATDYTLRKRIYQTQKARNELDWQKSKVLALDQSYFRILF